MTEKFVVGGGAKTGKDQGDKPSNDDDMEICELQKAMAAALHDSEWSDLVSDDDEKEEDKDDKEGGDEVNKENEEDDKEDKEGEGFSLENERGDDDNGNNSGNGEDGVGIGADGGKWARKTAVLALALTS
jgi:hypothetical protein